MTIFPLRGWGTLTKTRSARLTYGVLGPPVPGLAAAEGSLDGCWAHIQANIWLKGSKERESVASGAVVGQKVAQGIRCFG